MGKNSGIEWIESKCCLATHPEFGGCCCRCRYRLRALKHDRGPDIPDNTWACIVFAFMEGKRDAIAYIGDFEHGMCELFTALPWPLAEPTVLLPYPAHEKQV